VQISNIISNKGNVEQQLRNYMARNNGHKH